VDNKIAVARSSQLRPGECCSPLRFTGSCEDCEARKNTSKHREGKLAHASLQQKEIERLRRNLVRMVKKNREFLNSIRPQ